MARTELFGLEHEIQVVGGHPLTHQIRAVADHHVDPFRLQLARAVDDVAEHRLAGNGMEDLGRGRTHAGALAGGGITISGTWTGLPFLVVTGKTCE